MNPSPDITGHKEMNTMKSYICHREPYPLKILWTKITKTLATAPEINNIVLDRRALAAVVFSFLKLLYSDGVMEYTFMQTTFYRLYQKTNELLLIQLFHLTNCFLLSIVRITGLASNKAFL